MMSRKDGRGGRFTFPISMLGPRGLLGPMMFVACPVLFCVLTMAEHPLGAAFLLPAILYAVDWLLLVPRYVRVHPEGVAIVYWLREELIPAGDIAGARAASEEELLPYWGILLPYHIWATVKVDRVGPVRIIATTFREKYALITLTTGQPLLIGCHLSSDLVRAARSLIVGS